MIGQTISHYRIVSQLGAGGMGIVYAALDPRLNRQVALKFVPDELAHDPHTIERLRSEARTASGLSHPNICTIYDIGEHEGRPFIVMELLKGHTLRERMGARPLKIHEAVDIGIQVADALYWAHSRDVIHRDIKPANLFLVDQGQVKILDFGLAKFVAPQAGSETLAPTIDLTGVGVALGTVAYMSPEQVSGEVLDRRTDLFSLGVVLYECVTGQQPFQGKTSAVVLASILTQQPTPPMTLNASVPPGLQEVIHNCLEKDRELRFQDAAGLRADLKRVKRDLESGALRVAHTASVTTVNAAAPPSDGATSPIPIERPDSGSTGTRQPPAASNGRMVAGIAAAAIVVAAVAAGIVMSRRGPAPPEAARVVETTASPAAPAAEPPAAQPTPPAPVPRDPAAERARAEARAATARFDAAIVDANRFLAAGDADAATRALNTARAIDPGAPAVADLSARLVEHFKAESARRATTEPARPQPPQRRPAEPAGRQAQTLAAPPPAPPPSAPPAEVTSPPPVSPPQFVPRPAPEPAVVAPPPARTEPERRPAPAAAPAPAPAPAPAEDDDTIIRRVVATYGRAIETKDLALYRSVKPNLTGAEQRTIEDGFRAVSSQRVTINIQSIEHHGQEAIVRLRRHDVIQAGGRQQTADSQQSLTLVRSGSGWVIREIGR